MKKIKILFLVKGPTKFIIDEKYKIDSKNTFYDREDKIIFGDNEAIIKDTEKNIIKLQDNYNLDIDKEIIKSKKSIVLDKNKNKYIFENLILNLKTNEIIGKELKVEFKDSYFGNENNDPTLKASSYSNKDELKVYKKLYLVHVTLKIKM